MQDAFQLALSGLALAGCQVNLGSFHAQILLCAKIILQSLRYSVGCHIWLHPQRWSAEFKLNQIEASVSFCGTSSGLRWRIDSRSRHSQCFCERPGRLDSGRDGLDEVVDLAAEKQQKIVCTDQAHETVLLIDYR